ncbi:hypothetical protein CR513_16911, partial [Mucuna pruriens]
MQSVGSRMIPSQTIPNPTRGGVGMTRLRSAEAELRAKSVPLPFPNQIPKYAKFLKELCVHKRRKMKGAAKTGGVVSLLVQHEDTRVGIQRILPKKCPDPGIFVVPCIIGGRTFTDAMLDFGASVNMMPASIYKSLNLGDLESTGMEVQLANWSVVQPFGILEDVNELVFPADFYVLDMEDDVSEGGSALILGRPFLMTEKTKIDVHARTLSMEFGDTHIEFNIFEALKHPTEDHSTFSLDAIDGLVKEYFRLGTNIASLVSFVDKIDAINEFCIETVRADSEILPHMLPFSYFGDVIFDLIPYRIAESPRTSHYPEFHASNNNKPRVSIIVTLISTESDSRISFREDKRTESDSKGEKEVVSNFGHLDPLLNKVSQPAPPTQKYVSPQPQATELKPLLEHFKYAYLGDNQQFPIIIANNLHRDQEEKLLEVLKKHKKAFGWTLVDLPGINTSICMHKILLEEDARLVRQQQRRMNLTLLDIVKKGSYKTTCSRDHLSHFG